MFAQMVSGADKHTPDLGYPTTFNGEPSFCLTLDEFKTLSEPFKNSLIGRFLMGRPTMEVLRKFISSLGLKSEYSVGLVDDKHVLI